MSAYATVLTRSQKFLFIEFRKREREVWGERERERNTDLLFHLFMHSLVDSCMCSDWGSNSQSWYMGRCSNQLSYPARATNVLSCIKYFKVKILRYLNILFKKSLDHFLAF